MGRGKTAEVGDTRIAKNGYHYTKIEDGWKLTHHLTAAKVLGRPVAANETVKILDKTKPYDVDQVQVIIKKTVTLRRRKAIIESKMEELRIELEQINEELDLKASER